MMFLLFCVIFGLIFIKDKMLQIRLFSLRIYLHSNTKNVQSLEEFGIIFHGEKNH